MEKLILTVRDLILKASNILGKPPSLITRADLRRLKLYNGSLEEKLSEFGGLSKIKSMLFPVELSEEELKAITASNLVNSTRNKLQNLYGRHLLNQDELNKCLANAVKKAKFKLHKPIKFKKSPKKYRTIVAHVSDTHFGANIEPDEMGNVNIFNWTIAARRMALFAKQIAEYKEHHRKETDLVIMLNGDIMAGVIHNQEWFVDLLAKQQVGTIHLLSQFISYLAQKFSSVRVLCSSDNHGRAMHKTSKDRGTTHKWDNYLTPVYVALREIMKYKHKNVTFDIPKTPYVISEIQGHMFFQTHGDTVINVGNPGKSLNMKSINEQITRLNSSDIGGNRHFDAVVVGHVHVPTVQLTDSGTSLIINGTLSGADPYAQAIGIFSNNAAQQIFEVTREHAVGDMRFIKVASADNDESLDRIIEPYDGDL